MLLENLIDNNRTDKNTTHSYLPIYEELFRNIRDTALNILEIGIQDGGSIKLWRDYFEVAHIYGVDIDKSPTDDIKQDSRITLYTSNAYDKQFISSLSNIKFDVIIDDGPHTLDSMKIFVREYSKLLNSGGILVVEDVQRIEWIVVLKMFLPDELKNNAQVYDLRESKGRYDDILFVVKNNR